MTEEYNLYAMRFYPENNAGVCSILISHDKSYIEDKYTDWLSFGIKPECIEVKPMDSKKIFLESDTKILW